MTELTQPRPATSVEERVAAEREVATRDLERAQVRMVELEGQIAELSSAEQKLWQKLERSGQSEGQLRDQWEQADLARHRCNMEIQAAHDRVRFLIKKIAVLDSPEELARRAYVSNHMKEVRRIMAEKTTKPTAKDTGVPDIYLSETGNFKTGMDARYKSDLVLSALGLITKEKPQKSLMVFEPADAEKRLAARNWTKFLIRKREIHEAEQKAKAAKAAEREEQTRQAAARKQAKKDAKKDAAKNGSDGGNLEQQVAAEQAAHDAAEGDAAEGDLAGDLAAAAKPDPKPAPKAKARTRK
jgi:hypothetical protein